MIFASEARDDDEELLPRGCGGTGKQLSQPPCDEAKACEVRCLQNCIVNTNTVTK